MHLEAAERGTPARPRSRRHPICDEGDRRPTVERAQSREEVLRCREQLFRAGGRSLEDDPLSASRIGMDPGKDSFHLEVRRTALIRWPRAPAVGLNRRRSGARFAHDRRRRRIWRRRGADRWRNRRRCALIKAGPVRRRLASTDEDDSEERKDAWQQRRPAAVHDRIVAVAGRKPRCLRWMKPTGAGRTFARPARSRLLPTEW